MQRPILESPPILYMEATGEPSFANAALQNMFGDQLPYLLSGSFHLHPKDLQYTTVLAGEFPLQFVDAPDGRYGIVFLPCYERAWMLIKTTGTPHVIYARDSAHQLLGYELSTLNGELPSKFMMLDTALSLLPQLEREQPMNSHVHYWRGVILMHSGSLDAARNALRKSIYCDPSQALAHYTLGDIQSQRGNIADALRCWPMAERAIAGLDDDALIPAADDLTVEMFKGLLEMCLSQTGMGDN